MAFEEFGQLSKRRREERAQKFKKKIFIAVICTILFLICVAGGIFAFFHFTKNRNNDSPKNDVVSPPEGEGETKISGKIIEMLCEPTDYKKKCGDTLNKVVSTNESNPSIAPRMIIKAAISAAADEVVRTIKRIEKFKFDKPEDKAAYGVCKKLFQDSVDELGVSLNHAVDEVKNYHTKINDLKTWLSAVYSYQETCIDAFDNGTSKNKIKESVNASKEYISNSLALVSQISTILDKFDAAEGSLKPSPRHLLHHHHNPPPPLDDQGGFPEWVGHEERKLAVKATSNLVANLTVAKDGSGNFTSINDCLKSLPENRSKRIYIFVKEGFYEEYVIVTKKMVNITMFGEGSQKSVITGNKNFVDGVRTFETATFAVMGDGFVGIALGFNNTAGPEKHQAVALRVQADRSIFLNCRMEAYQDTLYAQTHRQFYRSCYISGTIDFIFGDASAIFQNCMIIVRKPMDNQQNIVTAQGRADKHENTGFVIQNCRIYPDKDLFPVKHTFKSYLGRPWKQYSRTIVMESTIGEVIAPEGWMPWQGNFALNTLYYAEFNNHGPGANTSKRVKWGGYKKSISRQEAQGYTVTPFLQGTWIRENPTVQVHFGLYN